MSLNIKNEAVHALVREAAARTGRSQTSVVEDALRAYLDAMMLEDGRLTRRRRIEAALATIDMIIAEDPGRYTFNSDALYDENGLPS